MLDCWLNAASLVDKDFVLLECEEGVYRLVSGEGGIAVAERRVSKAIIFKSLLTVFSIEMCRHIVRHCEWEFVSGF
jgi:hypothetical protein